MTEGNLLVLCLVHLGIYVSDRQFAAQLSAHLCCTRLRDVEFEVGLTGDIAQVRHIHRLAQLEIGSLCRSVHVLLQLVQRELEVDISWDGRQASGKLFFFP